MSSPDATLAPIPLVEVSGEPFPSAGWVKAVSVGLLILSAPIGRAEVINTALLDEGAAAICVVSKVCTMLPIGGTVATGSVWILDAPLAIDGMAVAGGTCVLVPASTVWMRAGPRFVTDVLSSLICSGPCDGGWMEDAAAPCCGCATGPAVVTEATRWAGRGGSKVGARVITEEAGIKGPPTTGRDDTGADILDRECATAGEHSACAEVATVPGTRCATDDIRPGAPTLGGNDTRVGVPTVGGAKLPFVLTGNTAEATHGSWTGLISAAVARSDGATVGAHATKG